MLVSIVILTFNRPSELFKSLSFLENLMNDFTKESIEVIVVDNASEESYENVKNRFEFARFIRLPENIGVAGRNRGIALSKGDFIITLDDDVFSISSESIGYLIDLFRSDRGIGAINFRVLDEETNEQINWCHHRKIEVWGGQPFDTYEISEGAVAFRRRTLEISGLYPEYFFISHEGPDLALRIMNSGYRVVYRPEVSVYHSHAEGGRKSWRRYYYDSRNLIWLLVRCYPAKLAAKKFVVGFLSMMVYSLRDRYFKYFVKGIVDGLKQVSSVKRDRVRLSRDALSRYKAIERLNPSVFYMIKKRFFSKGVNI